MQEEVLDGFRLDQRLAMEELALVALLLVVMLPYQILLSVVATPAVVIQYTAAAVETAGDLYSAAVEVHIHLLVCVEQVYMEVMEVIILFLLQLLEVVAVMVLLHLLELAVRFVFIHFENWPNLYTFRN
jgi:hypothetical protein